MSLSFGTFITWASPWLPGSYRFLPGRRSRDQPVQLRVAAADSKILRRCESPPRARGLLKHGIYVAPRPHLTAHPTLGKCQHPCSPFQKTGVAFAQRSPRREHALPRPQPQGAVADPVASGGRGLACKQVSSF